MTNQAIIAFSSHLATAGEMKGMYTADDIENEPMLFSFDREQAERQSGPMTLDFLRSMPDDWQNSEIIIDSRSHMLMKGFYPAIPGWHLDDVPRTRQDGQPDHINPEYKSEHIMAVYGNCAMTEFAVGSISLADPPLGTTIYGEWSPLIDKAVSERRMSLITAQIGCLYEFNWQTWHRAVAAERAGWRWFIRASRNTSRKPVNKIRKQVNVYLPNVDMGW